MSLGVNSLFGIRREVRCCETSTVGEENSYSTIESLSHDCHVDVGYGKLGPGEYGLILWFWYDRYYFVVLYALSFVLDP